MKTSTYMDIQMDADRNYFELHPKAKSYTRKPFANERTQGLNAHGREPKAMEVVNFGQGLRFKKFVF